MWPLPLVTPPKCPVIAPEHYSWTSIQITCALRQGQDILDELWTSKVKERQICVQKDQIMRNFKVFLVEVQNYFTLHYTIHVAIIHTKTIRLSLHIPIISVLQYVQVYDRHTLTHISIPIWSEYGATIVLFLYELSWHVSCNVT